jgi:hypothetical protein
MTDIAVTQSVPQKSGAPVLKTATSELPVDRLYSLMFDFPRDTGYFPHKLQYVRGVDYGSKGSAVYWVEVAPGTRNIRWNRDRSEFTHLAFPYVELFSNVSWVRTHNGKKRMTNPTCDSGFHFAYFRNRAADSISSQLGMAALGNVSDNRIAHGRGDRLIQGWCCMIAFRPKAIEGWWSMDTVVRKVCMDILDYFLLSAFNDSSIKNEGFDWYQKTERAGIITLAEWKKLTESNPAEILTKQWLDEGMTPNMVIDWLESSCLKRENARARLQGMAKLIEAVDSKETSPEE